MSIASVDSKHRLYNLDLLRILAMFLIVLNHYLSHGVVLKGFSIGEPHLLYDWYIRGIGYTGTNLFVLITAFFLSNSTFKIRHILTTSCQVWFYSILFFTVAISTELSSFSLRSLSAFIPILTSQYWFITCYIGLYFLFPFLNVLVDSLSQNSFKILLLILIVFFSVVPSFFYFSSWLSWGGSSGIVWFVVLYLTGAYIRKYVNIAYLINNRRRILLLTALLSLLPLLSKIIVAFSTQAILGHTVGSSIFYVKNSILIYPFSVCIFILFLTLKIDNKFLIKIITFTTASVFSVYLITENVFIRDLLWEKVMLIIDRSSCWYSLVEFFVIIVIYYGCVFIDQVRKALFSLFAKTGLPERIISKISPIIDPKFVVNKND